MKIRKQKHVNDSTPKEEGVIVEKIVFSCMLTNIKEKRCPIMNTESCNIRIRGKICWKESENGILKNLIG